MLRLGSRGSAVVALQRKLGITADGVFGPQTQAALRAYQSRNGLSVDGIAGPQTLGKMGLSGGSSGGSTAGRTTSAPRPAPQNWSDTAAGRSAMYGWSQAVINSSGELKAIFGRASRENWTTDRFVAAVRDTAWFKTHSDTYRQAIILSRADPKTYQQRINQAGVQITSMAGQMGAAVSAGALSTMAKHAVAFNWTQDEIKQRLAPYIKPTKGGHYTGQGAAFQQQYTQLAAQYGVGVSSASMNAWVRDSVMGKNSPEQVRNYMVGLAASKYPSLAERLKAGETLQQIAEPYMQSYARTLEVNPNTLRLSDPMIQQALAYRDPKTNQPVTKTVWQFEQDLRKDPRYMKTQQAQDSAMKMARQVLTDWGVAS